jgi:hypothetical protein
MMTPNIFTTKVVGVSFCENYPQSIFSISASIALGKVSLELERDMDNEYDANAIKVSSQGAMIGYLPMFISRVLAKEIDNGTNWSAEVDSVLVSTENVDQPGLKITVWRNDEN